ncbi:hypothetical protein LDENG_00098620, partial [Lucifuga dentata]
HALVTSRIDYCNASSLTFQNCSIPSPPLRSSSAALLSVPPFRLSTMGARAFSCSAPRLWNSLPPHIHQLDSITHFKSQIKTHLFKLVYSL